MRLRQRQHVSNPTRQRFTRAAQGVAVVLLAAAAFAIFPRGVTRSIARPAGPASADRGERAAPAAMQSAKPPIASRATQLVREARRGYTDQLPYEDGASILLSQGLRFDPLRDGEPQISPALKAAPRSPTEITSFLVQMHGPIQNGWREALEAKGATVAAYLPNYTFLVRMRGDAKANVAAMPFVRWVGTYQPVYKLSSQDEMNKTSGPAKLWVLLFQDASLAASRGVVEGLGAQVLEATDSGRNKLMQISMDMSRIDALAGQNDVAWVEPWIELHVDNTSCQWVVQTNISNNRRVWDMGLHGEGQVVHTSDSGIRSSHNAFRDPLVPITTFGDYPTHRKIIAYQPTLTGAGVLFGDAAGASYHGTHTAGTFVGDDSYVAAADLRDGMSLKSKIWFSDGGASTNSIIAPGDLNLLFGPPYAGNAGGAARISSNSWGGAAAGAYTVQSMSADQFLWDHKDFLISFSNGNSGPGPATVGAPASFKDGVSSGACLNANNSASTAGFSSRGPAADGRIKPTIMSPGNLSSANGSGDTGYASLSGTSMSCPSVSGAMTLIRQYLVDGWYPTGAPVPANGFIPSGALVKSMAIASTDNDMTGNNIPTNNVGWGRVKLDNILYFPADVAHTALVDQSDGVTTGEFIEYEINVSDATPQLKIALCWYDKEGSPNAARQIVNDLDLQVTDPSATVYLGNVFLLGQSNTGGTRDSLNVEECVRRTAPGLGVWKIRVTGRNVPFGPQPFALAISGGVGTDNALLSLDRTTYGRDETIEIRVEDGNASSPITVQVSSSTEAAPENVSIAGANGVFVGTIATTVNFPSNGDNLLSISNGDAIQVAYSDASPLLTLHASAAATLQGPKITNVFAAPEEIVERITWTTDLQSTSRVYYGTTPALGQSSALDGDLVKSHLTTLNGLVAETTYYYDVESVDRVGNLTRDDNGGAHYQFTTSRPGDILLVIGDDGSFGQIDSYLASFQSRGWEPTVLRGGVIRNPVVGNLTTGMRSYNAVWWQVGQEQYPPFEDSARDSLTAYLNGGGRLGVVGHDIAWALTDPGSGYATPARTAWLEAQLHVHYLADPATWPIINGILSDPISGGYVAGTAYTPIRSGGAGDEVSIVAGTGTGNFVWRNTDATPDNIAVRWVNGVPNGTPTNAVWGGTPTKTLLKAFEWSQINSETVRTDVLDKSLIWLIGRDHPDVAITSPNGGETITTNNTSVTWTETAFGASIGTRELSYSLNGGASWTLITASAGTSPYNWDTSALVNGAEYRVRLRVTDDGTPGLRGNDASDANFEISRPNGDARGPVVQAGSINANPNPMNNQASSTLNAIVTDVGNGGSDIAAAEWSTGASPAAAGSGTPMNGSFDSPTVAVSVTVASNTLPPGENTVWIRGQDAAGEWGTASAQDFHVNGNPITGSELNFPVRYSLHQNAPNPFNPSTTIRFDLPQTGQVDLVIYDVKGTRVRKLLSARQEAGFKSVQWDGRDDTGRQVTSGVYFYRLRAVDFEATRKMVVLK